MKKRLELIVYEMNDILENTLLHADSNCTTTANSVGDYIGQCMSFDAQASNSGNGDGGGEIGNPCLTVAIAECGNWAACGLITFLR